MIINFNEKQKEYYAPAGAELPVSVLPKFRAAKDKAIELIECGKYGVSDADFWILMNANKGKTKMLYSGLIISHNGCLKINDVLPSPFNPECVTVDKQGFNGSLVYTYCNKEQGIYEVGEVSAKNCKNDYPYAMAYKRLFDRVVLKLSKIAYDGIYSEVESDEFKQRYDEEPPQPVQTIGEEEARALAKLLKANNIAQRTIGTQYGVRSLTELTVEQAEAIRNSLAGDVNG